MNKGGGGKAGRAATHSLKEGKEIFGLGAARTVKRGPQGETEEERVLRRSTSMGQPSLVIISDIRPMYRLRQEENSHGVVPTER